jgi:DNA-binding beta-propeller fold protein YncE
MHRWERSSVGWEEVAQIVAISPTARKDCFAVWDGRSQVRVLNAAQGRFTRIIDARGSVIKSMTRSVKDEAEFGAAASHVGPSKMAISADGQTVFVAASNRVIILDIHGMSAVKRAATMKQLDGARRALLALSTDNRYVVTAEGDVFGGLASRFATGPSRSQAAPCICVWDAATGELRRRITEVGYISDLSVANNCIAVVAAGPKRLSQNEPSMVRGEVLVFRFDTAAA